MSNIINNGGPAFPLPPVSHDGKVVALTEGVAQGMTLREYAAIKLRVPESGTDWLDKMILKSVRDEFAAKAMQAYAGLDYLRDSDFVLCSYAIADAMLRARGEA